MDDAFLNCTESSVRYFPGAYPYSALVIFKTFGNCPPTEFWILSKLCAVPTCQAARGPNPKSSITSDQQRRNVIRGQMLVRRKRQWHPANAVEADDTEFGTEPDVTIRSLGDCVYA